MAKKLNKKNLKKIKGGLGPILPVIDAPTTDPIIPDPSIVIDPTEPTYIEPEKEPIKK